MAKHATTDKVKTALANMQSAFAAGDGVKYCHAWDALQSALGGTDPASTRAACLASDHPDKAALLALVKVAPLGWSKCLMPDVNRDEEVADDIQGKLAALLA